MATILTKKSDTASSVPTAGALTNSTGGSELAVNTADKRLFTKDSGGTVVELGTNPSALTLPNGTANCVPYLNGSKVLTSGSALTFDGTNLGLGVTPSAWGGTNAKALEFTQGAVYGEGTTAFISTSNAYYNGSSFIYKSTNAATRYTQNAGAHLWHTASSGTAGTAISFTEGMRLTSTGLGIGTSSPAYPLHVSGSGYFTGSGAGVLKVDRTTGANQIGLYYGGSLAGYLGATTTASLSVSSSAGVEQFRIDSSGNLGLGVTPSAWSGVGNGVLQIAYGTLVGTTASMEVTSNRYYNGSSNIFISNGYSQRYLQNLGTGVHAWYTSAYGTAGNAISFTQAMTLDASGRLGIATTSPDNGMLTILKNTTYNTESSYGIAIQSNVNNVYTELLLGAADTIDCGVIQTAGKNNSFTTKNLALQPNGGNLLVGVTSLNAGTNANYFQYTSGQIYQGHVSGTSTGTVFNQFRYSGTAIGSITQNGTTAVAYNTSSDYRLKNTIVPMTGALAKVALLKPCTYKWNADGSDGEGFIAHELAEVVPQAVTGEKDAVDADGNPVYQGIDTSFLVATLTAAIQELKAEFDAYKASHP